MMKPVSIDLAALLQDLQGREEHPILLNDPKIEPVFPCWVWPLASSKWLWVTKKNGCRFNRQGDYLWDNWLCWTPGTESNPPPPLDPAPPSHFRLTAQTKWGDWDFGMNIPDSVNPKLGPSLCFLSHVLATRASDSIKSRFLHVGALYFGLNQS